MEFKVDSKCKVGSRCKVDSACIRRKVDSRWKVDSKVDSMWIQHGFNLDSICMQARQLRAETSA